MAKQKSKRSAKRTTGSTRKAKTRPEGLGDVVENVLEATGVAKVAKWVLGEDCGCEERKEVLNRMFPLHKPKCLTESEYVFLDWFFSERRNQISGELQSKLLHIYNRVFEDSKGGTSCSPCFVNGVLKKLEKVYHKYK